MAVTIISAKEQNVFKYFDDDNWPVFFSSAYHAFEHANGYSTGFVVKDNTVFMPFRIYRKWLFRFMQIMYPPMSFTGRLDADKEADFLNEMVVELNKSRSIHRIIQPFVWDVFQAYPKGATACPFGQLFTTIEGKTEEEIFGSFSPKYRNAIRKLQQHPEDITLKINQDEIDHFYHLYQQGHARQHIYFDQISHFKRMWTHLKKQMILMNLYYKNSLEGGAVVIQSKKEAYYLYGGAQTPTIQNGSIKLLQLEIIKLLLAKKVKKYIWGGCRLSDVSGTKQEGMQQFKLRFGAEIKKGWLWKADINPFYCKCYDLFMLLQHMLKGKRMGKDVIDYEKDREVII